MAKLARCAVLLASCLAVARANVSITAFALTQDKTVELDHRLVAVHEMALAVLAWGTDKEDIAAAQRILEKLKSPTLTSYNQLNLTDVEAVEATAMLNQTVMTAVTNMMLIYVEDVDAQDRTGTAEEDLGPNGAMRSWQGDMIPSDANQVRQFEDARIGGWAAAGQPWWDAKIKYCFAPDVSPSMRHLMEVAMAQYTKALPCMTWENVGHAAGTSTDSPQDQRCNSGPAIFIMSDPQRGCYSYVGQMPWASQQLQMHDPGCASVGTALHELGHTLGMAHEQSRPDRNTHVTIHWDNIPTDKAHNFDMDAAAHANIDYDYMSVMHYSAFAFAVDQSQPTITKSGGRGHTGIGQRNGLSEYDVHQLQAMYQEVEPTCAANSLDGTGCVDEPNDEGHDVCTGLTTCTGMAVRRCCACGGGLAVQCYQGAPCPQTERLPPAPESTCVQGQRFGATCAYQNRCAPRKMNFKCAALSCTFEARGVSGYFAPTCGGSSPNEICDAPDNCMVWSDDPATTSAPAGAASVTTEPAAQTSQTGEAAIMTRPPLMLRAGSADDLTTSPGPEDLTTSPGPEGPAETPIYLRVEFLAGVGAALLCVGFLLPCMCCRRRSSYDDYDGSSSGSEAPLK